MVTAAQISACLSGAWNSPFPCFPPPCSRPFHPAAQSTSCLHTPCACGAQSLLSSYLGPRPPTGQGGCEVPPDLDQTTRLLSLCFFSFRLDFNTSWRGCRILAERVRSAGPLGLGMDTWQQQVFGDRSPVATSCWWYSLKLELGADW